MIKTTVEQRAGLVPGTSEQITARLMAAFPKAVRLPADGHMRLAVPVGRTGLQQVVVDLVTGPSGETPGESGVQVRLCGYGKEGLLNRKPTRTITDQAWSALTTAG
jgi:hypothetical protein